MNADPEHAIKMSATLRRWNTREKGSDKGNGNVVTQAKPRS